MSKKSRERFKDRDKARAEPDRNTKPTPTLEALKRRRFKRFLFVGLVGIAIPILECVAYPFRAITVSFANKTNQSVKAVKVLYDGGEFELTEIRPGGVMSRVIRPNFSFSSSRFATYQMTIRLSLEDGGFFRQIGRVGTIDFSATELYTIEPVPPNNQIQLKHDSRPGFPLSLVRDLMERLGFG